MPAGTSEAEVVRVGIANALARPLVADIGTEVPGGQESNGPAKQGQSGAFLYLESIVDKS